MFTVHGSRPVGSRSSLTTMSSSKTTVLGIRLDHERRGWVEAEAAREGVSIRAYFERMIDHARSVGQDRVEPTEPNVGADLLGVGSALRDDTAAGVPSRALSSGEPDVFPEPPLDTSTVPSTASPGLCDELISVASIPGRVLREALGLPSRLINAVTRPRRRNGAF